MRIHYNPLTLRNKYTTFFANNHILNILGKIIITLTVNWILN